MRSAERVSEKFFQSLALYDSAAAVPGKSGHVVGGTANGLQAARLKRKIVASSVPAGEGRQTLDRAR